MISFFLGSGASAPFGYPVTKKFKDDLAEELEDKFKSSLEANSGVQLSSKEKVLLTILKHKTYKDIEYVFEFWKLMTKLSDQEFSVLYDFLVNNHFNGIFKGVYPTDHEQHATLNLFFEYRNELMDYITQRLYNVYKWDNNKKESVKKVYYSLFDNLCEEFNKILVFTTNYDSTIEEICRDKYELVDGFEYTTSTRLLHWKKTLLEDNLQFKSKLKKLFLYKLHGSLNWKMDNEYGLIKTEGNENPILTKNGHDVLIVPTMSPKNNEKEEPFYSLIELFKKKIMETDVCIVIGYSFRDSLNEIFYEFMKLGKKLIVISSTASEDFVNITNNFEIGTNNYVLLDEKISMENIDKLIYKIKSSL